MFVQKKNLALFPLIPVFVEEPFKQRGLDFIGEIHLPLSGKHKWILKANYYFIKRVEAIPTQVVIDSLVMKFLEENNFSRFGCLKKIVIDNV